MIKLIYKTVLIFSMACLSDVKASFSDPLTDFFERIPTNVLIIENDPTNTIKLQYMIINYFEDRFDSEPKFVVNRTGKGGKLAFDLFQPDLIFLDYEFSDEVNGIDIVKHIRETKKHPVRVFARSPNMMDSLKMYRYGVDIIMKNVMEMEELEKVFDYTFFEIPFKPIVAKPKGLISKIIKKIFK